MSPLACPLTQSSRCVLPSPLQAAAASAAPPAAKGRGRPSKAKAAAQGSGAAAAAAAAALLEDSSKVKLAGLVAVMGRLASAEPLVGLALGGLEPKPGCVVHGIKCNGGLWGTGMRGMCCGS